MTTTMKRFVTALIVRTAMLMPVIAALPGCAHSSLVRAAHARKADRDIEEYRARQAAQHPVVVPASGLAQWGHPVMAATPIAPTTPSTPTATVPPPPNVPPANSAPQPAGTLVNDLESSFLAGEQYSKDLAAHASQTVLDADLAAELAAQIKLDGDLGSSSKSFLNGNLILAYQPFISVGAGMSTSKIGSLFGIKPSPFAISQAAGIQGAMKTLTQVHVATSTTPEQISFLLQINLSVGFALGELSSPSAIANVAPNITLFPGFYAALVPEFSLSPAFQGGLGVQVICSFIQLQHMQQCLLGPDLEGSWTL